MLQALYSFFQSDDDDLPAGEKKLLRNIERIYELYICILSFMAELHHFYALRVEEAKLKYFPTPEELNPNTRFIDNRLISQLVSNRQFLKRMEQFNTNWAEEDDMLRFYFNELRAGEDYQAYMKAPTCSYEDDRNFLIKLVKNLLYDSPRLQSWIEEKNIFWSDDYDTALVMIVSTFKSFKPSHNEFTPLPALFSNQEDEQEDLEFAKELFRKTIIHSAEYTDLIASKAENWEIERIAFMDILILKMSITELRHMTSIPTKVTLNEYIEIAKQYSTPKSKVFVNGILDKLLIQFRENNQIRKTGRGLIDN